MGRVLITKRTNPCVLHICTSSCLLYMTIGMYQCSLNCACLKLFLVQTCSSFVAHVNKEHYYHHLPGCLNPFGLQVPTYIHANIHTNTHIHTYIPLTLIDTCYVPGLIVGEYVGECSCYPWGTCFLVGEGRPYGISDMWWVSSLEERRGQSSGDRESRGKGRGRLLVSVRL